MKLELKDWREKLRRYQGVLLVLLVGIILMVLPEGGRDPVAEVGTAEPSFSLEEFEDRVSDALSRIQGAGETTVVFTLKGGSRQVLAQDMERDGDRGSSRTVTVDGSTGESPVVLQTVSPQFQGALVICPGGEDPAVRLRLAQAVSALTGLGSDRISICKSE